MTPSDFAIALAPPGPRLLAASGLLQGDACSRRVRDLFSAIEGERFPDLYSAWLEFDAPRGAPARASVALAGTQAATGSAVSRTLPTPAIFLTRNVATERPLSVPIVSDALALLRGRPLTSAWQARLSRAFDLLPAEARIFQVGWFGARPLEAIRMVAAFPNQEATLAYLEASSWRGRRATLASFLARLHDIVPSVSLSFDVDPRGIRRRIGLECSFVNGGAVDVSRTLVKRPELFDLLQSHGLCTAARREAVLAWSGQCIMTFPLPRVVARALGHVKIVHDRHPVEAKAYVGARLLTLQQAAAFNATVAPAVNPA